MKRILFTMLVISLTSMHLASADAPAPTAIQAEPTGALEPTDTLLMGDATLGKALHDKSCTICHISMFGGDGSKIYTRQDRKVTTIEGLMARVEGCNKNVGTHFDKTQMDDVVKYLSDEFYKFTTAEESKMDMPETVDPKEDKPKTDEPQK